MTHPERPAVPVPALPGELREKLRNALMAARAAAVGDAEDERIAAVQLASLDAALLALVQDAADLVQENARYHNAIRWALGWEDFAARQPGQGAYWWRKELAHRAGRHADFAVSRSTPPGETP